MVYMKTNEDVVLIHPETKDSTDILEQLCDLSLEHGYINEEYFPSLIERETKFPTGLMFPIPLAIPHIEDGCEESFVAIAILENPIEFGSMDGADDPVPAELVFMFGIVNPQEQVKVLQTFAAAFANEDTMRQFKNSKSKKEALNILKEILGDTVEVEE